MKRLLSLVLAITALLTLAVFPANSALVDNAETSITFFTGSEDDGNGYSEYPFGCVGDVDENGKISIMDVTAIQKHIVGLTKLVAVPKLLSDINNDGKINISDATQIQRYMAQLDENSKVNTILYGELEHTSENMADFDKIVEVIKKQGTYNGNSGYPIYFMGGIGITEINDGHLYGGNYTLSYEQNYSLTGNEGSLVLNFEMHNEEISSKSHEIEIRILRGARMLDIDYSVYDKSTGSSELVSTDSVTGLITSFDKTTGDANYLFANQDTMSFEEYFGNEDTYTNYIRYMLDSAYTFCNNEIDDYTDVRIEDLN